MRIDTLPDGSPGLDVNQPLTDASANEWPTSPFKIITTADGPRDLVRIVIDGEIVYRLPDPSYPEEKP